MTNVINKAITEFEVLSSFPQYDFDYVDLIKELKACKEALEQPAQEPSWQGLSDDEMNEIFEQVCGKYSRLNAIDIDFIRAIEQALKERNT